MDPNISWMNRDGDGNFWIINSGILFFDPYKEKFRFFDSRNGLHENPGWASKLYTDSEGYLYNALSDGFEKTSIRTLGVNMQPTAKLILESLSVNDQTRLIQGYPEKNNPLKLEAKENNLTFRYTAICFDGAERLRYQYFLDGFDNKWSPEGTSLEARYTNLPPGSYVFRVKALFGGILLNEDKAFPFIIKPLFWKTWWFIMMCLVIIVAITYGIYRYRVKQLLKVERLRTRIATDLHDDVSSTLSSISILSDLLGRQTDNPGSTGMIGEIGSSAHNMLERMDDIIWTVTPANDKFEDLGLRINEYAIPLLESKNINYHFEYPEKLSSVQLQMEVRRNIYLIAKEAVNNLVKYSQCRNATVSFREESGLLVLEIRDDGVGFTPGAQTTRHGIVNMKLRAEKIGGTISIISGPGEGTRICLHVKII